MIEWLDIAAQAALIECAILRVVLFIDCNDFWKAEPDERYCG